MAVDKTTFELLKKTVEAMDTINTAVNDTYDISLERVLGPVLGEVEFAELSPVTQAKLKDLVNNYLVHIRAALEGEIENKAMDIQQLKS